MFRTPANPATFRRYFIRQVVWPVSVILMLVLLAAAAGLYWATSKSNQVSLRRQVETTRLALSGSADQLAYEQQSIATWDQLLVELARPTPDAEWLDVEIGLWLRQVFGHDMTFILGADGRPIYAFRNGRAQPASDFDRFRRELQPLVDRARALAVRPARDEGEAAVLRPTRLTRSDIVYEADAIKLAGHPAAASAMFVGEGRAVRRRPMLVSVRFLDDSYLQRVSAWGQIEGLRFSDSPAAQPRETRVELRDESGNRIGYFFWKPELPGTELLWILGPLSLGLILLLMGIMALLVRSLWRAGRQLSTAVVDLQASEAQAQHLAFHDVLTGLPNRALFNDRLDQALARARRGQPFAILALDLDRFKQVNDTLGHAAGDVLIRDFAGRLSGLVREVDTVARIGGDEFSILLCDTARRADIETLCDRILAAVREPFDLFGNKTFVGASIGVALVPEAGVDRGDVIRKADIALYRAKTDGKGCYRIFTPSMDTSIKLRADLEKDLRSALARGDEIEVHYQPEVGRDGRTIVGLEALLRWKHPTRGLVSPEQFVPIAEETGLISELGDIVLREACHMAGCWPGLFIAVNLSAVQFRSPDLAARIIRTATEGGCDPHQIELEITESVLLDEDDVARDILDRLREVGFRIALDDFGTGYSSLSYLRQFRVDKIKIDRSFTQNLGHDAEAAAIVTSMVTLGHAMGLTVTAEGVESRDQMRLLSAAGCNELQGFLFAHPMPEAEGSALLAKRKLARKDAA